MLVAARYGTNHDAYHRDTTRTGITIDEQASRCNRVACTTCRPTLFKKVMRGRFINSFFFTVFL